MSATWDPPGAVELAVVEASGRLPAATLGELTAEFRSRVAALEGDRGRIDRVMTSHELVTETYPHERGSFETTVEDRTVLVTSPVGTPSVGTEMVPVTT